MAEVKRGYRKLTVILPVKEFDLLTRVADENDREPGQQAAFMLKKVLHDSVVKEYFRGIPDDELSNAMDDGQINTEVLYERPRSQDEVAAGEIE
jgi:hypothetical protein